MLTFLSIMGCVTGPRDEVACPTNVDAIFEQSRRFTLDTFAEIDDEYQSRYEGASPVSALRHYESAAGTTIDLSVKQAAKRIASEWEDLNASKSWPVLRR